MGNKDDEQVVTILKGHTKKVSRVVYHPNEDTAITASFDSTIRIWNVPTSQTIQLLRVHDGPVTGLSLHATGDYILSTSTDQHWAFSDIRTGQLISKVTDGENSSALTCAQVHPDGLIFGTGTSDSMIKIWDLKELKNFKTLQLEEGYEVRDLCFDNSGTYLAVAGSDIRVYLCKQWQDLKVFNDHTAMATGVRFGANASYLASTSMDRTLKLYGL